MIGFWILWVVAVSFSAAPLIRSVVRALRFGMGKPPVPEYVPEKPFPGPVVPVKVWVYVGEVGTDYDAQAKQFRDRAGNAKWN